MYSRPYSRRGFSLVELSIVLVILGLLVGGILSGQSLIHASELRSVTTQANNYRAAVLSFRDKYFGLPGDLNNAINFWGDANVNGNVGTNTVNGNGDNKIGNWSSGGLSSFEETRFWQHLGNAGLVEGSYGANVINGNYCSLAYTLMGTSYPANCPGSKITNAGWTSHQVGSVVAGFAGRDGYSFGGFFYGNYGNSFVLTNIYSGMGIGINAKGVMTATDVWNLDTKMDDGKPATGSTTVAVDIRATSFAGCTDTTDPANLAANYLLSSTDKNCSIAFRNLF